MPRNDPIHRILPLRRRPLRRRGRARRDDALRLLAVREEECPDDQGPGGRADDRGRPRGAHDLPLEHAGRPPPLLPPVRHLHVPPQARGTRPLRGQRFLPRRLRSDRRSHPPGRRQVYVRLGDDPMKLRMYQVDAFADGPFEGNPAAVVPLDRWLPEALMQRIAMENNLAETAFFAPEGEGLALRWFTPAVEVPLCGHATLASSHVLFNRLGWDRQQIVFQTKSGPLVVEQAGEGRLTMDFPARRGPQTAPPAELVAALGATPEMVIDGLTMVAVFANPEQVTSLSPDMRALARFCGPKDNIGVAVTAPAGGENGWDFVSRFFAPAKGIDEDPVTGGAHCALTPYWADRLGRRQLVARQASARGGTIWCEDRGERVGLTGRCADYLVGEITV